MRLESMSFELFPPCHDLLLPADVHLRWSDVVERFVIPFVIVVVHKTLDLLFEFSRKIIVLQIDFVFHLTMVPFDCIVSEPTSIVALRYVLTQGPKPFTRKTLLK